MNEDYFLQGCFIFMGFCATVAAAYVVYMYRVMRDDFREQVKEIREAAKLEAEYRAQEMVAELLRKSQITIKQEIKLENDSSIDWGEK